VGSTEAIKELQLSSLRYYQRPDADYLTYDPNKKSISGHGGSIVTGLRNNTGFRYMANLTWRSPGLDLNDVGFLRKANSIFQFIWVSYKINKPFFIFRSIQVNSNEWASWDFGGNTLFKGVNINVNSQLKNLWRFGIGINRNGSNLSNTNLRGGPSFKTPGSWNMWANISSNSKKKFSGNIGMSLNKGDLDFENRNTLWVGLTYQPINSLKFHISPRYSKYKTDLQYVTETKKGTETRYIFGGLDQNTFNLTIRMDYNITPDLSIQYYGSPFVSSVLYDDFKKITSPKAEAYVDRIHSFQKNEILFDRVNNQYLIDELDEGSTDYSFSNPNFNFKQFRSNMLLRWEYTPGSTLFLVWSQGRTDYEECNCEFDFKSNLADLFKVSPRDIFLLKLSYRINAGKYL